MQKPDANDLSELLQEHRRFPPPWYIASGATVDPFIDVSTLADNTVIDRIAAAYRDSVGESSC